MRQTYRLLRRRDKGRHEGLPEQENGLSADGLAGGKTYDMLYSPKAKESPKKAAQKKTKANISKMIEVARSKLGCKYILGNTGPKSFDCSGLVYYCLKQAGSNRRRLTAAGYSQVDDWEKISDINKLKKGDLYLLLQRQLLQDRPHRHSDILQHDDRRLQLQRQGGAPGVQRPHTGRSISTAAGGRGKGRRSGLRHFFEFFGFCLSRSASGRQNPQSAKTSGFHPF